MMCHGTDEATARAALTEGIRPRSLTGKPSNWEHESLPDRVYLSRFYAGYFALCAAGENDESVGIIEVDRSKLIFKNYHPDEDYVEQFYRKMMVDQGLVQLSRRMHWIRRNIEGFIQEAPHSYRNLGNVAYCGVIPPEAIMRVTLFHFKKNPFLASCLMEPTITVANAKIMGRYYELIQKWLLGDYVNPSEVVKASFNVDPEKLNEPMIRKQYEAQCEAFAEAFSRRDSVEVIGQRRTLSSK